MISVAHFFDFHVNFTVQQKLLGTNPKFNAIVSMANALAPGASQ